jgi:Tfp pilus assembly PilM family ATPase
MSKKIKITESQLKTLLEKRHSYKEEPKEEKMEELQEPKEEDGEKMEEITQPVVNEHVEKFKSDFKRFL